jgi:very-short-patch-repair endonuclease
LVIEVDGGIHEQRRSDDRHRQRVLEAADLRVLRVSANACEQDIEGVLLRIRETFRSQADALPSPSTRERGRG